MIDFICDFLRKENVLELIVVIVTLFTCLRIFEAMKSFFDRKNKVCSNGQKIKRQ